MRLLFDEMLKKLASWARIFGIYSEYFTDKSDDQLLAYAKENKLIFVTRDVPLAQRCRKNDVRCVLIRSNDVQKQIAQLVEETGAEISFPEKTRCAVCNGELDIVNKESVKDEVPEKVLASQKRFWRCRGCGQVFWEGGHWKNIMKVYEALKKKAI